MALFRMRVEVPDEPGALARLATALESTGTNVVAVSVHHRRWATATDDLVIDVPDTCSRQSLQEEIARVGRNVQLVDVDKEEPGDEVTDALQAARQLAQDPSRLGEVLARLLRANVDPSSSSTPSSLPPRSSPSQVSASSPEPQDGRPSRTAAPE